MIICSLRMHIYMCPWMWVFAQVQKQVQMRQQLDYKENKTYNLKDTEREREIWDSANLTVPFIHLPTIIREFSGNILLQSCNQLSERISDTIYYLPYSTHQITHATTVPHLFNHRKAFWYTTKTTKQITWRDYTVSQVTRKLIIRLLNINMRNVINQAHFRQPHAMISVSRHSRKKKEILEEIYLYVIFCDRNRLIFLSILSISSNIIVSTYRCWTFCLRD